MNRSSVPVAYSNKKVGMAKDFIKKAVGSNKGLFKKKAEAAGKSTKEYAKEKASAPGKLGKEARLASTLMGLQKKKKK